MPAKVRLVKAMVFPVVTYGYESWTIKKTAKEMMPLNCGAGEDSWESPLDCKEIQPVNPEGNQLWIFIRRTDAEAEAPIVCPPDVKSQLIRKDPNAGKDWRQKEKRNQKTRWLDSVTNSIDMNLSKLQKTVKDRETWHAAVLVSFCVWADTKCWLNTASLTGCPLFYLVILK